MQDEIYPHSLLDGKLLLLFSLLYSTRSVTRTAEQMGQSQPTVSIWLARLREQLGDELFVRTGQGMQPTPRASALVDTVREALQSLQRIQAPTRAFEPAEAEGRMRICMTDASHITMLPRLLEHFRKVAPALRLEVAPIDDRSAQAMESGSVDLALGIVPGLESGFYQQTFYAQDFVCLVQQDHPQIGTSFTLQAYREAAHVEVLSGKSYSLLDSALKQQKVERNVLLQLPGFLGLARIVACTDLVATVPSQIGGNLAQSGGLRLLPCPVRVEPFTVKQYWHARVHQDPANRWLRSVCASLYMDDVARQARAAGEA